MNKNAKIYRESVRQLKYKCEIRKNLALMCTHTGNGMKRDVKCQQQQQPPYCIWQRKLENRWVYVGTSSVHIRI